MGIPVLGQKNFTLFMDILLPYIVFVAIILVVWIAFMVKMYRRINK